MDTQDAVRCAVCNYPVSDHEPGVSSVYVDGLVMHPGCAAGSSSEANSYGVPCLDCGEWETACKCVVES